MKKIIVIALFAIIGISGIGITFCSKVLHKAEVSLADSTFYKRDKEFIRLTVKEFIRINHYYFDYETNKEKFNLKSRVEPTTDTVFYSPDRLKLIAFVILKIPETGEWFGSNRDYPGSGWTYKLHALVGIRDRIGQVWRIYEWPMFGTSTMSTPERTREAAMKYFFGTDEFSMKQQSILISDGKGWFKSGDFKYHLGESEFWDSSVVWKKDAIVDKEGKWHYVFQVYTHLPKEDQVLPEARVALPDSLKQQFEREAPPAAQK